VISNIGDIGAYNGPENDEKLDKSMASKQQRVPSGIRLMLKTASCAVKKATIYQMTMIRQTIRTRLTT